MPLKRKPPPSTARVKIYCGPPVTPRATVRLGKATEPKRKPIAKTPDRLNQAIRDSARGEDCLVRIVGVCTHDPAMTIWSHAPLLAADKGRSIKALDLCGAYACTSCDAVVDGQRTVPAGASQTSVLLDWMMGHMRSLVRLRQKGLV